LLPVALCAQNPAGTPPPAGAPTSTQGQTPPPQPPKKSTEPDYPDPRTLTVGISYWLTLPSPQPNLIGGLAATSYSTLDGLGKPKFVPGLEISYPITRTGELHFEGFEAKGDGTQTAPAATALFATGYNKGDFLSTQYQITSGKLYLDDLLHPFKFPVEKFRLKSLWEVQYLGIMSTIDAPLKTTSTSSGTLVSNTTSGSRNLILPTFGIAAEYAISPHVLLRADASGFGLPHRAELWDAEGTISYRRSKTWEIRAGFKVLHFKTSPQKDEYVTDTISGGFVGLRYHWN
jgi:hypothetical protein